MSKQFNTLFPHISDMTDNELRSHIGEIRRRKYIERPASKRRVEKAAKPESTKKSAKVTKLVQEMSPDQISELMKLLEGEQNG